MPNVTIKVGGREFDVACQEGEEHFLQSAAKLLDNEASALVGQIGRMPEPRMLLMSGLMLADKTAGMQEQLGLAQTEMAALRTEIEGLKARLPLEASEREAVLDSTKALADRAEALAAQVEAKAAR